MSVQTMTKMVDEMFAAFSRGDIDGFTAGLADDVVYEESTERAPIIGREAFKEYASTWMNCCSNRQLKPRHKLSSGNEMVVELHYEGTHDKGELYGLNATGKQIIFDFVLWLEFDGERIRQLKAFYNPLQPMQQIGAA